MNEPKFIKSELKVRASEELEEEIRAALEEDLKEKSMASILNKGEDNEENEKNEEDSENED